MRKNWTKVLSQRETWDKRFMQLAYCVRGWSKDPKSVGAVLVDDQRRVISTGYNGFPGPIADTTERLSSKETKNQLMIHAELNSVLNSVVKPAGSTMYATRFPCHRCAAVIAQVGIVRVVSPRPELTHETWGESHKLALEIFNEAGIELTERA